MWNKLLALFKDKEATDGIHSVIPEVPAPQQEHVHHSSNRHNDHSTHIGYNYLKGLDGDYEDSSKHLRRFINLNKLLRGNYNAGKIEATHGGEESDLRGEDTE